MKIRIVALACLIGLIFSGIFVAGCVEIANPAESPNISEFIGKWTVSGPFFANGEPCDATFTLEADGTGLRELVSTVTGNAVHSENITWKQTGDFDNVKITYEDGYEEIASLGWLKGSW